MKIYGKNYLAASTRNYLARLVLMTGLIFCLDAVHAGTYVALERFEGYQLTLRCPSEEVLGAPCELVFQKEGQTKAATPQPVSYVKSISYQGPLLRTAVSANKLPIDLTTEQVEQINALDFSGMCRADLDLSDLFVACKVVALGNQFQLLFVRGMCDRCTFIPVVLKRSAD